MPPLLVSLFPSLRHLVQTWWDELHLHHIFSRVFCVFCLISPISFNLWSLLCKLNSQLNISLLISCCCITLSSRQWIAGSWFHERPKSKRKYWRTISLYFKYYTMIQIQLVIPLKETRNEYTLLKGYISIDQYLMFGETAIFFVLLCSRQRY